MKCHQINASSKMLFQIIPIKVYGPKGVIETYAMFDSGADISIIDEVIASKVGIDGPSQDLNVKWIDESTKKIRSKVSDIQISGVFKNAPIFNLHGVRIMDRVSLPSQPLNVEELNSKFKYLTEFPLTSYLGCHPKSAFKSKRIQFDADFSIS